MQKCLHGDLLFHPCHRNYGPRNLELMTYKQTYCLLDLYLQGKILRNGTGGFEFAVRDLIGKVEQSKRLKRVTWVPHPVCNEDGYLFDLTIETND